MREARALLFAGLVTSRSIVLSLYLLATTAPALAQDKAVVRIERLRRAIEADPDDVAARVRLIEEVDALGPPWSTYELLIELAGAAPPRVRAWAHVRLSALAEAAGQEDRAVWHAWHARRWSGSAAMLSRLFAPEHRFFFLSATTPEPYASAPEAVVTIVGTWTLGTSRVELRRVRVDEHLELSLVLVAIDPAGAETLLAHIGDEWSNAGDSWWTTVDRASLRPVEGRVQLVLEGEVLWTDFDPCWISERHDRFVAVCEPPREGRPGGCVRWTTPGPHSMGRHHQFSNVACDPGLRFRVPPDVELGRIELGPRGLRWRGRGSLAWSRRWRSLDMLRVGAPASPREPSGHSGLEGPLPPRLPIDPPTETKVEVPDSTPAEALRVFERLFDDARD